VGGTNSDIIFNHFVQSSCEANDIDAAKLMKKYADVFVTRSLEGLPPHREHFDCEVNLKEGADSPNSLLQHGVNEGIKEKYYRDADVVDWSKLNQVLDVWQMRKDKFEYLLSWQNATVGDDTWVSQDHIPDRLTSYLTTFRKLHQELYEKAKKKQTKALKDGE
jgi:hypothetical protein